MNVQVHFLEGKGQKPHFDHMFVFSSALRHMDLVSEMLFKQ